MNDKHLSLHGPQSHAPSSLDKILWWLATAEKELIQDCIIDRNRYRIVGLSVLGTWLFASLAWTYFFSTATDSGWVYISMGLFMGFIILSIDRTLIKGISRGNRNKLGPLLFRGLLAITIGAFMAQPAVLYLFDKEVKMQASIDNEGRKQEKRKQLEKLYQGQLQTLTLEQDGLQKNLDDKYKELSSARQNFIAETDGSGGSGKIGISTIALAKRAEYEKLQMAYDALQQQLQPRIDSVRQQLGSMASNIREQENQFAQLLNHGFLTRIQALQNLIKNNNALASRYYLIVLILMLIELMPVIAKSMLPSGVYDEKMKLREELEKTLSQRNAERELEWKEYYNNAALAADKKAIDEFFTISQQHRTQKIATQTREWSSNHNDRFDGLWQQMKRVILTRWEN